ncbi:MAG: thioredoxin fold domain-containing protein, partial [Bdellovibrionales bacterium]
MIGLLLAIGSAISWASPAELLQPYSEQALRLEVVKFRPKSGYHFSLTAPQKCGDSSPVELTAREILCQFAHAGPQVATLNVCDDKETFCKPVSVALRIEEQSKPNSELLVKNQDLNEEVKKKLIPGFISGDPAAMKAEVERRGHPVLLMISTDWCPPCNETKEYLFRNPEVLKAMETLTKVYVDGDSLIAGQWDAEVPYRYYPSFVFLNDRFQEIGRYTGELRAQDFLTWLEQNRIHLDDPIVRLKKRVFQRQEGGFWRKMVDWVSGASEDEKSKDEERLMAWALDQEDHDLIARLGDGSRFSSLQIAFGRYQLGKLSEETSQSERITLLKGLVSQALNREDWAELLDELCEMDLAACKPEAEKVPLRLDYLANLQGLTSSEKDSVMAEEQYYFMQIFKKLNNTKEMRRFAQTCVQTYEKLGQQSQLGQARGAWQGIVPCLEEMGDFKTAEARLKTLIEQYPNEATFLLRMARSWRKRQNLIEALKWIEKAEKVAYG